MELTQAERDELIESHVPVVGYQVSQVIGRLPAHVQREDLASAGALALVQAARSFDPDRGVPFARYASLRIRGAIVDELRSMDWISRGGRQRSRRLSALTDELTGALGRTPTEEELAEAMGVDPAEIRSIREVGTRRVHSLDADPMMGTEVPDGLPGPEDNLLATERLSVMRAAVSELPERLRFVIVELFENGTPAIEVAEAMGVTQSRVSQLRTQALALLRDAMNATLDPEMLPQAASNPGVAERRRLAYFSAVAARTGMEDTRVALSVRDGSMVDGIRAV